MALISPFLVRSLLERIPSYQLAPEDDFQVRKHLEVSLTLRADQPEAIPVLEGIARTIPDSSVAAPQWFAALTLRLRFRVLTGYSETCKLAAEAMDGNPTYTRVADTFCAIFALLCSEDVAASRQRLVEIAESCQGHAAHLAHTYLGLERIGMGDQSAAIEHYRRSMRVQPVGLSAFMTEVLELASALADAGHDVETLRREALFGSWSTHD